jgi:Fic family protein
LGNILNMSSFSKKYISKLQIHPSIAWSVSVCTEARGRQELWSKTRPELILQLKESAIIQSAESSNRIEGVEVEKNRLKPLLTGASKPRDRSEEEVLGYRKALDFIYKTKSIINPDFIARLHKIAQGGLVADAGKWKNKDNEIIEFSQSGDRKVRFKCTTAKETPAAIKRLCDDYHQSLERQDWPDLLIIANFIFDFLCIHPFRDGNGRVSRLLTLSCLLQLNYQVGKFVSLERIIEASKADYYESLGKSSLQWHESAHDLYPWWSFFLSHLKYAYQELKDFVDLAPLSDTKTNRLRHIILNQVGEFKIQDILNLMPGFDREIVKKTLSGLNKEGLIQKIGNGRGSRWINIHQKVGP